MSKWYECQCILSFMVYVGLSHQIQIDVVVQIDENGDAESLCVKYQLSGWLFPGFRGHIPPAGVCGGGQYESRGGVWQQHNMCAGTRSMVKVLDSKLLTDVCAARWCLSVVFWLFFSAGRAVKCAQVLSKASLYPVRIVRGGFQKFSALYPFLRTEKIMYTIMVRQMHMLIVKSALDLNHCEVLSPVIWIELSPDFNHMVHIPVSFYMWTLW